MDKDVFYEMDIMTRVKKVNSMLEGKNIQAVAKEIGIPPSTFSKEMQRGDYFYLKRDNKYYHFVREVASIDPSQNKSTNGFMIFLMEPQHELKELLDKRRANQS